VSAAAGFVAPALAAVSSWTRAEALGYLMLVGCSAQEIQPPIPWVPARSEAPAQAHLRSLVVLGSVLPA